MDPHVAALLAKTAFFNLLQFTMSEPDLDACI